MSDFSCTERRLHFRDGRHLPGSCHRDARVAVDHDVEHRRNAGPDRLRVGVSELIGMLNPDTAPAHRLRHLHEVGVPELPGPFVDEAGAEFASAEIDALEVADRANRIVVL